ncbi:Mannose-6-phosphate isomerase [Thecaphora frezii]
MVACASASTPRREAAPRPHTPAEHRNAFCHFVLLPSFGHARRHRCPARLDTHTPHRTMPAHPSNRLTTLQQQLAARWLSPPATTSTTIPFSTPSTATMATPPVFQIIPGVQCYDWGIKGSQSRVAQFAVATKQLNFTPADDKPCAELWMGTHPSCPSRVLLPGQTQQQQQDGDYPTLSSHLAAHPELIGEAIAAKFSDEEPGCLPFLFKVLSVGKALSIQAHPDKQLGKMLHQQRPDIYKDPNHKPEMAIALTPFSGFCGFRPLSEIAHFVEHVDEFATLCALSDAERASLTSLTSADPASSEVKAILRIVFSRLMSASASSYEPLCDKVTQRFASHAASELQVTDEERELLLTLSAAYPRDIGIFCTFLLNITSLREGEAMFLQANEPHAYLSGEILECMAASDNVVRAGLTPKLRDVETLIEMCTYTSGKALGLLEARKWEGVGGDGEARVFSPPIDEFDVATGEVERSQTQPGLRGPSILIGLEGEFEVAFGEGSVSGAKGSVFFVASGTQIEVRSRGGLVKWARALVEP